MPTTEVAAVVAMVTQMVPAVLAVIRQLSYKRLRVKCAGESDSNGSCAIRCVLLLVFVAINGQIYPKVTPIISHSCVCCIASLFLVLILTDHNHARIYTDVLS
jgi:hypothetical protein